LEGNIIVKYYYDAYGNIQLVNDLSGIGLGTKNPFRFKSYYYDEETQFYYLNSRYYDPFTGRFISADDASLLLGGETNIFKYCANNAIMNSDPSGYRYEEGMDVGDGSRHYTLGEDWFPNCDDLAAAWAAEYLPYSENVEMCAIIFKAKMPDGELNPNSWT
jgi:RHS repeat-associated protein